MMNGLILHQKNKQSKYLICLIKFMDMQKVGLDFKNKQKDTKNKINKLKMIRQLMKKKKIINQNQRMF
jgi:hypothetical protein